MHLKCLYLTCAVHVIIVLACHVTKMCSYAWDTYPNPQTKSYRCGRKGPSLICDPSQILPFHEVDEIDQMLLDIRSDFKCSCETRRLCNSWGKINDTSPSGYTVSVALMSFIPRSRSQVITVESYANYLRAYEWKFDQCGDDVVVVYSLLENKVGASVGAHAAEKVTDSVIEDIISDTRFHFDDGNTYHGLVSLVTKLRTAFDGKYYLSPGFPLWTVVQITMAVAFVLCCFSGMSVCRRLYG